MAIKCENLRTVLKYLLHLQPFTITLFQPFMVCTHQPDLLSACCSRSDKLEGSNHKGGAAGLKKRLAGLEIQVGL